MTTLGEKKLVRNEFVPIEHILRPLVCGYPRGTGKGFLEDGKGTRAVREWYLESFSDGGERETERSEIV